MHVALFAALLQMVVPVWTLAVLATADPLDAAPICALHADAPASPAPPVPHHDAACLFCQVCCAGVHAAITVTPLSVPPPRAVPAVPRPRDFAVAPRAPPSAPWRARDPPIVS